MPRNGEIPQRALVQGEIDRDVDHRADLAFYQTALRSARNVVIRPEGGVERMPGSRFVLEALPNSILVPFQYNTEQAYMLEIGVKADASPVMRVFVDAGVVLDGASPLEVTTPWAAADLSGLYWTQTGNLLYVFHPNYGVRKITRTSDTAWTVTEVEFTGGPFRRENSDDTVKLYTTTAGEDNQYGTGAGGITKGTSITLRAFGADVFSSNMVGQLIQLTEEDGESVPLWEAEIAYAANVDVRWEGNVYKMVLRLSGAGANPPIHTEGEEWDGSDTAGNGLSKYRYLHSGKGIVKITAYTDARQVTAEVVDYLPAAVRAAETGTYPNVTAIDGGTWRWAEEAWCEKHGYPAGGMFHQRRLWGFRTQSDPQGFWASVSDSFENFTAGTFAIDAFSYELYSGQVNEIAWMLPGKRVAIGTSGEEMSIPETSSREAITPDSVFVDTEMEIGSAPVRPVRADGPVFVSADQRHVIALVFDFAEGQFADLRLSRIASHLTEGLVDCLAWQRKPYRLLWVKKADGTLAVCTYDRREDVRGWAPVDRDCTFETIAVMYALAGANEELWWICTRTINGESQRFIERLEPFFEQGTRAVEDAWFLDCAIQYSGVPVTSVSGLDHVEGETVAVFADGQVQASKIVSSGSITLDKAASKVLVGLPFDDRTYIETLPLDTNELRRLAFKRVPQMGVSVKNAYGLAVSTPEEDDAAAVPGMYTDGFAEDIWPVSGGAMDSAPVLRTGVYQVDVASDPQIDGVIKLQSTGPYPFLIKALYPNWQVT